MLNVRNIYGTVTPGVLAAAGAIVWTAALGLAQAQTNELVALVQIYQALGGGWQ